MSHTSICAAFGMAWDGARGLDRAVDAQGRREGDALERRRRELPCQLEWCPGSGVAATLIELEEEPNRDTSRAHSLP